MGQQAGDDEGVELEEYYNWWFICVLVFVVAGTVGNVLVCLAVSLERPLQNVTNWFLVSLAFADLLVSTIVMPFGAAAGFLGYWPLGVTWCNVYVTCDVLACSASILHMCCISLGRYLGIRSPIRARHSGRYASKRMVVARVVAVWLLALLISSPLSALGMIDESNIMIGDQCVINNRGFAFFGSLATFYIPMIIMFVSYALTVHLLRSKAQQHQLHQQQQQQQRRVFMNRDMLQLESQQDLQQHQELQMQSRGTQTPVSVARERRKLMWKARISFASDPPARIVRASAPPPKNWISTISNRTSQSSTPNISSAATVANEQKASKVLGVVFFTFVLCWAPFFILNVVTVVCSSCSHHIPDRLVAFCLWLGYLSSTINPIIYTVFNRTFKRVFIQLLCCRFRRSTTSSMSSSGTYIRRGASIYDGLTTSSNIGISLVHLRQNGVATAAIDTFNR